MTLIAVQMMQITLILPTTTTEHFKAARRCVRWLEDRFSGFAILDLAHSDPSGPPDALVGQGVVRGFWKDEKKAVHRDRSVMLLSDIAQEDVVEVERHIREFISHFFLDYEARGVGQKALYVAVQGARDTQWRGQHDPDAWQLTYSTGSSE